MPRIAADIAAGMGRENHHMHTMPEHMWLFAHLVQGSHVGMPQAI